MGFTNVFINRCSADELASRLEEITSQLNETGTYTPTTKELEFGARTAWRNASRVSTKSFKSPHAFNALETFFKCVNSALVECNGKTYIFSTLAMLAPLKRCLMLSANT